MATENPKLSSAAPSVPAVSFCGGSVHIASLRVKTKTAPASKPASLSSKGAPATSVSPTMATENPKPSAPPSPSSFCCSVQVVTLRVKTKTAPASSPVSLSSKGAPATAVDRKSTRLNSSHLGISYAVFCLKKKKKNTTCTEKRKNPSHLPVRADTKYASNPSDGAGGTSLRHGARHSAVTLVGVRFST